MIPLVEIKERAVAEGVPETTIIKDYVLSWILKTLNDVSEVFALKGGTGIRKAYIEGYRFSADLDFTLTESVNVKEVLLAAIKLARRESGIEFEENLGLKIVRTGYEGRVLFMLYYRFPMRIKIDITAPENEVIVLPTERRRLIHPYSDECSSLLLVYPASGDICRENPFSLRENQAKRPLRRMVSLQSSRGGRSRACYREEVRAQRREAQIERFLERREAF